MDDERHDLVRKILNLGDHTTIINPRQCKTCVAGAKLIKERDTLLSLRARRELWKEIVLDISCGMSIDELKKHAEKRQDDLDRQIKKITEGKK